MNTDFLLIGSGRLAQHLRFVFSEKKFPFSTWSRGENRDALIEAARGRTHVAFAVSDRAIDEIAGELRAAGCLRQDARLIHFSGSYHRDDLIAAHPLMSFGPELYPIDFYSRIHFTLTGTSTLTEVLPGWTNSFSILSPEDRARYHALCVLGGNFPVLLWDKMSRDLRALGIPQNAMNAYIERVAANFVADGAAALTGPLVRGDHGTIAKNLDALKDDRWALVYKSFVEATT